MWGDKAGWAQTVMFIDDLKNFEKDKSRSLLDLVKSDVKTSKESIAEIEAKEEISETTHKLLVKEETGETSNAKKRLNSLNEEKLVFSSKKKKAKRK